jgi:hypothetical protein
VNPAECLNPQRVAFSEMSVYYVFMDVQSPAGQTVQKCQAPVDFQP